jgi:hypothetical protein
MGRRTPVATRRGGAAGGRAHLALLAELREVDHWRRLVTARLDLAVAAVAAIDEPVARRLATSGPASAAVPCGLRELLGLAAPGAQRGEAAVLLRLRGVQRDLDAYASGLRAAMAEPDGAREDRESGEGAAAGEGGEGGDDVEPAPVVVLAERRRRDRPDGVA